MSCETKAMKCIMHVFNVLMIISGVFLFYHVTVYIDDLPSIYIGYLYFIAGLSLLFGLFGFLGICKENVCLMKVYAGIILVTVIAQGTAKCFSYKLEELVRENAKVIVTSKWLEETYHPGAMYRLQKDYKCCGYNNSNDYTDLSLRIPNSCYSSFRATLTRDLYKQGCLVGFQNGIVKAFSSSDIVEWVVLVLTAILFGFALYLIINFVNKKRRNNYKQ